MERTASAFPVLPGKSAAEIVDMWRSRPDEYRDSRRNLGITLERGYHQSTPMGDFAVAYLETEGSPAEAFAKVGASELEIDRDFVRMVKDVHGIDLTAPPPGPPPETIAVWTDPEVKVRGRGLAFCAPGIPGQEDAGRAFGREAFRTRKDELTASRRALRQSVEVVTLQGTPQGPIICVYLEGEDPAEANRRFAASQDPFDLWFKDELTKVFPPEIDFSQPVPPVKELFDSQTM
jgi:hypothetical protein